MLIDLVERFNAAMWPVGALIGFQLALNCRLLDREFLTASS